MKNFTKTLVLALLFTNAAAFDEYEGFKCFQDPKTNATRCFVEGERPMQIFTGTEQNFEEGAPEFVEAEPQQEFFEKVPEKENLEISQDDETENLAVVEDEIENLEDSEKEIFAENEEETTAA